MKKVSKFAVVPGTTASLILALAVGTAPAQAATCTAGTPTPTDTNPGTVVMADNSPGGPATTSPSATGVQRTSSREASPTTPPEHSGITATAPGHGFQPGSRPELAGAACTSPSDFDQDGHQDLLAKSSDGRLMLYRGTGAGGFVSETRRTVGTGWNTINSITTSSGFTTGSSGLMTRLSDGRLAHYAFRKGVWGARAVVGSGWSSYNILR